MLRKMYITILNPLITQNQPSLGIILRYCTNWTDLVKITIDLSNYCKILATVTILTREIFMSKVSCGQNAGDEVSLAQKYCKIWTEGVSLAQKYCKIWTEGVKLSNYNVLMKIMKWFIKLTIAADWIKYGILTHMAQWAAVLWITAFYPVWHYVPSGVIATGILTMALWPWHYYQRHFDRGILSPAFWPLAFCPTGILSAALCHGISKT